MISPLGFDSLHDLAGDEQHVGRSLGEEVHDRLPVAGRLERAFLALERLRAAEHDLVLAAGGHAEHEVPRLAGRHVGHHDRRRAADDGEQICRVVGKVRNAVFRDDAHDLSLCIVGGRLPRHAAQEGRQLVPLLKCD